MLGMQAPGAFSADATVHAVSEGSAVTAHARAARIGTSWGAVCNKNAGGGAWHAHAAVRWRVPGCREIKMPPL